MLISKIQIGKIFKGHAEGALLPSDDDRGSSVQVSRRINSFFCHDQKSHGAVHQLLYILYSFCKRLLPADQGADQLSRIDLSSAHLQKMSPAVLIGFFKDLLLIIYLPYRSDRKASQMGLKEQRLRFIVRDAPDPQISL